MLGELDFIIVGMADEDEALDELIAEPLTTDRNALVVSAGHPILAQADALHRALALAGAEILTSPAAFTRPTGAAHWEILLRARAIETGSFVLAAAQGGEGEGAEGAEGADAAAE